MGRMMRRSELENILTKLFCSKLGCWQSGYETAYYFADEHSCRVLEAWPLPEDYQGQLIWEAANFDLSALPQLLPQSTLRKLWLSQEKQQLVIVWDGAVVGALVLNMMPYREEDDESESDADGVDAADSDDDFDDMDDDAPDLSDESDDVLQVDLGADVFQPVTTLIRLNDQTHARPLLSLAAELFGEKLKARLGDWLTMAGRVEDQALVAKWSSAQMAEALRWAMDTVRAVLRSNPAPAAPAHVQQLPELTDWDKD